MRIRLYSTGCPRCLVLEKKLEQKGVKYELVDDVMAMRVLGLRFAPALQIDEENPMDFTKAIEWVNAL